MQQFIKKNLTLILAFLLPILLIFIVAINAYFPFSFLKTDYNFVYAACDENDYRYPYTCDTYARKLYSVENNRLVINPIPPNQETDTDATSNIQENYKVRLFLHNTESNESREISLEEAQNMSFDKLLTSPDDVTITSDYERSSGGFLFDTGSSFGYYLVKGKMRSKLRLINDDRYYSRDNFHFIGWVLK